MRDSLSRCSLVGVLGVGVLLGMWLSSQCSPMPALAKPDGKASVFAKLDVFARALNILETEYIRPLSQEQLVEAAIAGMTTILDPHTDYLSPREAKMLREEIDGAFGGVGLVVQWDREWLDASGKVMEPPQDEELKDADYRIFLRVVSVMPNSPAQQAGLMAEDAIVSIEGRAIAQYLHLGAAVMRMRGPVGTKVQFEVRRGDKSFDVQVKRGRVEAPAAVVRDLGDGIMHLSLREFSSGAASLVRAHVEGHDSGRGGVILDLRDNGGGLLDQAVQIVDLFVSKGLIVLTRGRKGKVLERWYAHRARTLDKVPLVVLINKGSASASEIVAGALQDHERALLVGERSYGKGSVQIPFSLGDGSLLKTTIALYYTPNDRVIQARGIAPDLWVGAGAQAFVETRPDARSERDAPGHLGQDLPIDPKEARDIEAKRVPTRHKSQRAVVDDPQLRAAVDYLLAAKRLSR